MASCEMCGKTGHLLQVKVEESSMELCEACAKFGQVIRKQYAKKIIKVGKNLFQEQKEDTVLIQDYGRKIKKKRQHFGFTQEELAKKLAEKESIISKLESENYTPQKFLINKIERVLKIKITEEAGVAHSLSKQEQSPGLTIGDLLKRS